jgi:hypothetical protein
MTIYAPTYCPETSPCNPCCFQIRADWSVIVDPQHNVTVGNAVDLGNQLLCSKPFVWPFVQRTVLDSSTGNRVGYWPMGFQPGGTTSPSPGHFDNQVRTANLVYNDSLILTTQITTKYLGVRGAAWAYQEISCNPAPVGSFQIRYEDAISVVPYGQTLNQFFGDYSQSDPANNSPIQLTGFVYTDKVDYTQDIILEAAITFNYALDPGFWSWGAIYYAPAPVSVKQSQLGHRLPLVRRFQIAS